MPSRIPGHCYALLLIAGGGFACSTGPQVAPEQSTSASQDLYGLGALASAWTGGVVPVCFQNPADHPELQALIPGILAGSWSKAANITFTGFGACPTSGNRVTLVYSTTPGFRGSTSTLGAGTPTITLVSDDASVGRTHFVYEVIHEMGHALGFAHEMKRPSNWNGTSALQCGVPPTSPDFGNYQAAPGGLDLTPNYDSNSIMNYCDPNGANTTQLSVGDILAASSPSAYGPAGCVFASGGTQCTNGWSTNVESTYSVPAACPATTGWVMKPVGGQPLLNACTDGSAPGACTGSNVDVTRFVLGWEQAGLVQSGPATGTQQSYVMCDAFDNCSPAFQLVMEGCSDLFLNVNNSPLEVTQGGTAEANVLMVGPWIAGDLGLHATGVVISSDLPAGSTITLSAGFTINSDGAVQINVTVPLSTPVGAYHATIQVTDAGSGQSRTTVVPIQVLGCVAMPVSQACSALGGSSCGLHSLGCGLTTDCGGCASGNTCTTSGVCCPDGYSYNANTGSCMPPSCPPGTDFCDAADGACLTPAQCNRLTHCHGTSCM